MNLEEFFQLNKAIILFIYGQVFFTLGLAIFLQSRKHSRLKLARHLRWLAGFGILHGLHEWGLVFIPIQTEYLQNIYVRLLEIVQMLLLVASFGCLFIFGVVALELRRPYRRIALLPLAVWLVSAVVVYVMWPDFDFWISRGAIWARYLLGFPGAVLSAYSLYRLSHSDVVAHSGLRIARMLLVASISLIAYGFFAGLVVREAPFFPANALNGAVVEARLGIPIEVFRSLAGLFLTISMIRTLEIFQIEVDRLIERMEVETIQAAERNRIGQEIHDGAIQAVYSASLVLESVERTRDMDEIALRLSRTRRILEAAVNDLRRYMVSLRQDVPSETLDQSLRKMVTDPRFCTLMDIHLDLSHAPLELTPIQIGHVLAVVQESLSNSARHAEARSVSITTRRSEAGCPIIAIKDDGHGFELEHVKYGFGLTAMQERARLLGGDLHIESAPGKPTIITLTIMKDGCE